MSVHSVTTQYAVKFDCGYYAAKQPNYHWSYTHDLEKALLYKTEKAAQERLRWGLNLTSGKSWLGTGQEKMNSGVIQKIEVEVRKVIKEEL